MATWGRGRHILPSVASVLAQEYPGFELLVVGDQDAAATGDLLAGSGARWINLPERVGSQSGPNNAGIAAARGDIIAYIGHDDLWEPDHLSRLMALFDTDAGLDFAVSGCLLHMPEGISGAIVSGMFGDDDPRRHFVPPSSFAHRKSVSDRIGPWGKPFEIRMPVDADLLSRAHAAGMRFATTDHVTVHKFAAGQRYLSYLTQDSAEQEAMLAQMGRADHAAKIAALIAEAKASGTYMCMELQEHRDLAIGHWARSNVANKGLRPTLIPLTAAGVTIVQTRSNCALDWHEIPQDGIRWSLRARYPKVLVPVTGTGRALVRLRLYHTDRRALARLEVAVDGQRQTCRPRWRWPQGEGWRGDKWQAEFALPITLDPAKPAVLTLFLSTDQTPTPARRGIGLGQIRVTPIRQAFKALRRW